ncbi:MAG: alpha/beta hydrolase [Acidimicrobiales bacterium]
MAFLDHGDARIHYEVSGNDNGFPVLTIAPGGMRSEIAMWSGKPWNPLEALVDEYRLVAMDQRNAGSSTAPVGANDGWATYTDDQIAVLDHLGIESCHVVGMCIGGPYIAGLLQEAPERFVSAVMLQPVGVDGNREAFVEMFDGWAAEKAPEHPEADEATWESFRSNMWDGDFVLTASRDEIATWETPLLVLMGDDQYHPQSTSREIARLAPNATLVERWKDDDVLADTDATITSFLARYTP